MAHNALLDAGNKASKSSVHYSKGMAKSHCGICAHFKRPDSCTRVAGTIVPDMWCKLFKRKD